MKEQRRYKQVDIVSSINADGTTGYYHAKIVNLDIDPTGSIKIDSKWIRDLKRKYKTIKLLENNILENLDTWV